MEEAKTQAPCPKTDDELLALVGDERKRSIGFGDGDGGELTKSREQALRYYRGEMNDVQAMPNRSKAVSTDVAEAIETVLPDLIEIFVGGDDVATFQPVGEEDEEAAQQETDYTNHVVHQENPGFLNFYTAFKDALLTKTGLLTWWWEDETQDEDESFEGKTEDEMALAQQGGGEIRDLQQDPETGLYSFTLHREKNTGRVCVKAFPPEDFTVAQDTVELCDTSYCAARDRPRAQDLIERGVSREIVESLPAYGSPETAVSEARDEAGENDLGKTGGTGDLRIVETVAHYIKLLNGDETELWRVVTGGTETVLISKERVTAIPFGAITPFTNSHRFYGESLYDKLMEIQRLKTAVLRMMMDDGYFALNQRNEVAMSLANEWTVADLIRNEPGVPIRTAQPGAVRAISAGGLNFDTMAVGEYLSVMGEQRTGVVRNAQGLNPDALHDTAKGMQALMGAAQKRVRLIARIFAETGLKAMYLGVHALVRENATAAQKVRLRGKWVNVDPSSWGARKDMSIEIGLGSAGREQDLMAAQGILEKQAELVQLQGGLDGPLMSPKNAFNALSLFVKAAGKKTPELFFSDPDDPQRQQALAQQPPKQDPEMAKVEGQLALQAKTAQANAEHQAQAAYADVETQRARDAALQQAAELKATRDHELAVMRAQGELELKRQTAAEELALKRELLIEELQMKREAEIMNAQIALETGMAKAQASTSVSDVQTGGEPG